MLDPGFKFNKKRSNKVQTGKVQTEDSTQSAKQPVGLRLTMNHDVCAKKNQPSTSLKALKPSLKIDKNNSKEKPDERRSLTTNAVMKWLDALYWKRVLRYLYIRFLRMRSSPRAIARGVAAGAFAGSFPLLGMQTIIGVAIASVIRGSKVVAAASTWISNPLTYVPLFALNFHIGRRLLRMPKMDLPSSTVGIEEWMAMGMDVASALMLGSFIVGIIFSILGYYIGLNVAQRVRKAKAAKRDKLHKNIEQRPFKQAVTKTETLPSGDK